MDPPEPDKIEEPEYFQMYSDSGIVSFWPTSASVMRRMQEDDKRKAEARALSAKTVGSGAPNNVRIPKKPETTTSSSTSGANSQGNSGNPAFNYQASSAAGAGLPSPTWSDCSRAAAASASQNIENSENVVLSPSHANGLAVIASAYADEEDLDEGSVSSGKDSNNEEPNDPNGIMYMGTSQPFHDISNHGNQSDRNRELQQQPSSQPRSDDVHLEDLTSSQVLIVTESSKCRWDRSSSSSGSSGKLVGQDEEVVQDVEVPEDIIGDHHVGQGLDEALQQPEAMEESVEEDVVAKPKKVLPRKKRNMTKSGLVFRCHRRFQRRLKKLSILRVSNLAAVYSTAVIEFMTAELLELAGKACKDMKMKRLIPRHILLAIKGDEEFDELLKNVLIPQGGVKPYVHQCLTRGRGKKSKPKP